MRFAVRKTGEIVNYLFDYDLLELNKHKYQGHAHIFSGHSSLYYIVYAP